MNMKMDEEMIDYNNYQLEIDGPQLDIELPHAAINALKDATVKNQMIQKFLQEEITNNHNNLELRKKNFKDFKVNIEQH